MKCHYQIIIKRKSELSVSGLETLKFARIFVVSGTISSFVFSYLHSQQFPTGFTIHYKRELSFLKKQMVMINNIFTDNCIRLILLQNSVIAQFQGPMDLLLYIRNSLYPYKYNNSEFTYNMLSFTRLQFLITEAQNENKFF